MSALTYELAATAGQEAVAQVILNRVRDPNFWSVRVNKDVRIIVHKTAASLLLCYVDHHDDAVIAAYDAPFPTEESKAGPRVMPTLVPKASSAMVATTIRTIFAQPDREHIERRAVEVCTVFGEAQIVHLARVVGDDLLAPALLQLLVPRPEYLAHSPPPQQLADLESRALLAAEPLPDNPWEKWGWAFAAIWLVFLAFRERQLVPSMIDRIKGLFDADDRGDGSNAHSLSAASDRLWRQFACAETDIWAPPETVAQLQQALVAAGVPHRLEWYPGAQHGFVFPRREGRGGSGGLYEQHVGVSAGLWRARG